MNDDLRQQSIESFNLIDNKKQKNIYLTMERTANKNLLQIDETLNKPTQNKLNSVVENKIVWVYIEFENIGEVDTMSEKYQAKVRIVSKWYHIDDSEDVTEYDPKRHWYPKLYIENALHDVKEEISYKTKKFENGKSLITEIRIAKGSFWERLVQII